MGILHLSEQKERENKKTIQKSHEERDRHPNRQHLDRRDQYALHL